MIDSKYDDASDYSVIISNLPKGGYYGLDTINTLIGDFFKKHTDHTFKDTSIKKVNFAYDP